MIKYAVYCNVIFIVFMLSAGCGKKERSQPVKMPSKEQGTEEKNKDNQDSKEIIVKTPATEEKKIETQKTPEQEKPSDETGSTEEAEKLYQEIIKLKEKGEYQQALLKANDLMSRLPKSPQATKVIPLYYKLRNILNAKRSFDSYFEILIEATEIRDRYAAEKFFMENSETAGSYLADKLPHMQENKFETVLELLTKIKSTEGLEKMISFIIDNSRPQFRQKIITFILTFEPKTLTHTFRSVMEKRKMDADKLPVLMQSIEKPRMLVLLGTVYADLPDVTMDRLKQHVKKASEVKDMELYRELALIDGLLKKYCSSSIAVYIQELTKKGDQKSLSETAEMRKHLFALMEGKEGSRLKNFINDELSSTIAVMPGLKYRYYEEVAQGDDLVHFSKMKPKVIGVTGTINLNMRKRDENISLYFEGVINIPKDGEYTFYTTSDDGSRLYIAGKCVVNNDGYHGMEEKSGKATLKAGFCPVTVTFYQGTGGVGLNAHWEGPGIEKQEIPKSVLFHWE